MESVRIFDHFKLHELDELWIKSVWDSQFLIYDDLPEEYFIFLESVGTSSLLEKCCAVVKAWLSRIETENHEQNGSEVSWHTLIVSNINLHGLLAILGYILKNGRFNDAEEALRQSSLRASRLYFNLLAIPGSGVFNVFHPNLYQSAIQILNLSEYLMPIVKNKHVLDENSYDEDEMNDERALSNSEKAALTKGLNNVIFDFVNMTKYFWFKNYINSLEITVYTFLEVTKLETDIREFRIHCSALDDRQAIFSNLSNNAYMALRKLCDIKHGPVDTTVMIITKYLLPRFLFVYGDLQIKSMANTREASVYFLKNLQDSFKKEARNGMIALIQHIILKCPERLEARQKQADMLMKILNTCTESIFLKAVENITLFSHHNKVSCRIFTQEIIGKFLSESSHIDFNLSETLKSKVNRIFMALVLSRCTDSSNMVRGKAMAILAEYTESCENNNGRTFKSIFQFTDPNKPFHSFDELRDTLSNDNNPLPGLHTVINMLMERIEDERALVRRSTLQIFKNLVIVLPMLISKIEPALIHRCRDPAMTVRRFAIQVFSQILEHFPNNSELLSSWVEAVIPQIFDVEVKVEEKVLECLGTLLINKIKNISTCTYNDENELPWRILNKITNLRMRKHLSKACNLWVKNGVITKFLITNIQSHIGTDNNLAVWVLLVALAENMNLPGMNKYIVDYEKILQEDSYYASLVLQVLSHTWKSLDDESLKCLSTQLYNSLCKFEISFELIGTCVDIVNKMIQYIHSTNANDLLESKMAHLMNLSETEIKKIVKSKEQANDEISYYLEAMSTLGHVAFLCTNRISPLVLHILEGLILEWESLPSSVQEINELQPTAVVVLGQQALRDRDIAQEIIPIFGKLMRQEVHQESIREAAIKINAAKVLADLCIRFTALVEPYLSDMCVSMKDSNSAVREAIMVIFIQLLMEDYIKVKGPFFFHILTMLTDPDEMIRDLTVFLIEERLLTKNKMLISQQYIESIYHYNNYQHKYKFSDRRMKEKERKALTFPGKKNQGKRKLIYDFMLEHLDPPGKIKLLIKITSQVLNGVYHGIINVKTEEGANILQDVLYIISNDRLQPVGSNRCNEDILEQEESANQFNTVSNAINVIIEGMKKHGLDVLLPMLIKLKDKLAASKSTLEKDVMKVLVKIYSDYNKEQLTSLIEEYPKLEEEIDNYRRIFGRNMNTEHQNLSMEGNVLTQSEKGIPRVTIHRLSSVELSNYLEKHSESGISVSPVTPLSTKVPRIILSPVRQIGNLVEFGPGSSTPRSSNELPHKPKVRKLSIAFREEETSKSNKQKSEKRMKSD